MPRAAQGKIEKATAAELRQHAATTSMNGQLALSLAKRLDAGDLADTAVPAVVKELRSIMDAVAAHAVPEEDPLEAIEKERKDRQAKLRRVK